MQLEILILCLYNDELLSFNIFTILNTYLQIIYQEQSQKPINQQHYIQKLSVNMKRRQDSDIFGAKNDLVAPRIHNDSYVDPNAVFQKRMNQKFQQYAQKFQNTKFQFKEKTELSKVMDDAYFDQDYHRNRKGLDLQSSIFYPPTIVNSSHISRRVSQNRVQEDKGEKYFGKRQTLSRQTSSQPQNADFVKGNTSRLFGFDERVEQNESKNQLVPLIPHQMKWDQYDSVRYQGNTKKNPLNNESQTNINDLLQSESRIFNQNPEKPVKEIQIDHSKINMKKQPLLKKETVQKQKEQAKKEPIKKEVLKKENDCKNDNKQRSNVIEIKLLSGWNNKYLEGLTKQCHINSTKLIKFQFQEGGKGLIVIEQSKRWENVSQWIRKQVKAKIRILKD